MSLVDYDSSSSDDENDTVPDRTKEEEIPAISTPPKTTQSNQELRAPCISKLPDASMLLNSPSIPASDQPTLASRKRDSPSSSSSSLPRGKLPRAIYPHSKNIPETSSGLLVPPQLRGRSNIVTEDIGKLFVKKQAEPSSQ